MKKVFIIIAIIFYCFLYSLQGTNDETYAQAGSRDGLIVGFGSANAGTLWVNFGAIFTKDTTQTLIDSFFILIDDSGYVKLASILQSISDSTQKAQRDSFTLQLPIKPYTEISFSNWDSYPDYVPDLIDTLEVRGILDSVGSGLYPAMTGYHPDTSSEVNAVDIFSQKISVPLGYVGIDSIVFDYKTGRDVDTASVKIDVFEVTTGGVFTFMDSTTRLASVGSYTHDATLTTLGAITRFDKFKIKVELRSYMITGYATISRFLIYWKKQ